MVSHFNHLEIFVLITHVFRHIKFGKVVVVVRAIQILVCHGGCECIEIKFVPHSVELHS